MPQFLFDTDHLTLQQHCQVALGQRVSAHPPGTIGVSVVSVEEALRGRLATLARARSGTDRIQGYAWLTATLQVISQFPIIAFDQASEHEFQQLLNLRLRIGTQDLKIAAIALAHKLTVLTRNRRDFGLVPGMTIDDWSV